ncbi:YhgE/Pip family protein [Paenibacillus humicus]|uniref:YhgE/Pip family protein n=1 Tax=Paenibacillus humicus TaxID=412861 RepID=UPI003F1532A9
MKALNVVGKDLKDMFKKPMLAISFIAVAFVPILYSGFLIKASWDPYGHLEKLPVAVVNEDAGAVYKGKTLDAGHDFIDELKKNEKFDWQFVSPEQAEQGMKNNDYYMTIRVPKDFSAKATTLMNDNPERAEIIFEPNGDYNFIAGQIGNSAMKDIRADLSSGITKAYTESMFDQVKEISDGFSEASNGAGELKDGASKVDDGVAKLKSNLAKLAEGTQKLQSGMDPLSEGAGKLKDGTQSLVSGSGSLASGLGQLHAAGGQLEQGASAAKQGTDKLAAGLQQSADGSAKLQQGLQQSADGSAKLQQGLQQSADGSAKLADSLASAEEAGAKVAGGAEQVAAGWEQLVKANPELADNEQVKQLLAATQQVAQGSSQLSAAQKQLTAGGQQLAASQQQLLDGGKSLNGAQQQLLAGSTSLSAAQKQLLAGAQQLQAGTGQLETGLQQFNSKLGDAVSGGTKLASGAKDLSSGASQLAGGLGQLAGGVGSVADGTVKLENGAGELKDGTTKLIDGSGELQTKLKEGADKTSDIKDGQQTVDMFADPVQIKEDGSRKIELYGVGIAPYFISMALFVGALFFTTVISSRHSFQESAGRLGRFMSRTSVYVLMSISQSVVATLILMYGLKLTIADKPLFVALVFAASLTFTLIVQALVTWGDQVGRYLVVMLMILQLTSSAGTFPKELLPEWMQAVNPWLPMSHSITGLRAAIGSGDSSVIYSQMGCLGIYAAIALALTALYFGISGRKKSSIDAVQEPAVPV